ncbi:MAG: LacI family transcriptional regulator, partial [Enterococcus faecium]|nr:LacI family transcriptional regulator [Enterococcus faecium]
LAIGALKAIKEAGLAIPQDISVIGFNDISVAKYVSPPLSTVKVYTEWMGELAVETLTQLIHSTAPVARKITIATELILRESTKQATIK